WPGCLQSGTPEAAGQPGVLPARLALLRRIAARRPDEIGKPRRDASVSGADPSTRIAVRPATSRIVRRGRANWTGPLIASNNTPRQAGFSADFQPREGVKFHALRGVEGVWQKTPRRQPLKNSASSRVLGGVRGMAETLRSSPGLLVTSEQ